MPTEAKPMTRKPVLIDLALQGGGSHGAFTWGVLDRRPKSRWLTIDGISGTSAGAMNAAVLVHGHQMGGAAGAREALGAFWRRLGRRALQSVPAWAARCAARPLGRSIPRPFMSRWIWDVARLVSPYHHEPHGQQLSLLELLAEAIDFKILAQSPIHLFITATNVRTGRRQGVQERCGDARHAARLGLSADDVPGDRDRRRGLLGRGLFRQSDAHPARPPANRTARRFSFPSIRSSARAFRAARPTS